MIKIAKTEKECVKNLMEAYKSGNSKEMERAWNSFHDSVAEKIKKDYNEMKDTNDANILAQRGVRQLTNEETKFYEKWIEGAKSNNPRQAISDLMADGGMPETILEDVYKNLVEEHPLLAKIQFQNVKYLTKWLLNDHSVSKAVWGKITDKITKEIESGFKLIEIVQGKLSAFVLLAKDMLDLGPVFLDSYVREILKEALACGLEYGIVKGTGVKGEPIGLVRDIHEGVEFNTTTGYPEKTAIKVLNFLPASYGELVNKLAKTENGKTRKLSSVQLLVNQSDYLTKIMPATTVLNAQGTYSKDIFPFPTEVIVSNALDDGEALLCLLPEYFLGVGASKNATLVYSDEYKFLDDVRTYLAKIYAAGQATDNTVAIKLDISKLDPAYITVLNKQEVTSTSSTPDNKTEETPTA